MTEYVRDDDPVAQDILDKEDDAKKEAKKKYGDKHKVDCFHEDILRDTKNDGHN